ncbi:MAG: hypothetical protein HWE34_19285 [Methylocystaceae bacterium]|nr:hypothetical protein [Methylocystaceae bacterium]
MININHRPQVVPSNTQGVEGLNDVTAPKSTAGEGASQTPPLVQSENPFHSSGALPTQVRDVVPSPDILFDPQALTSAQLKLNGGLRAELNDHTSGNQGNVTGLLAPFVALRERIEGGQGNLHLVNWMRDQDINETDAHALNASIIQTSLFKVLEGAPQLQAAFEDLTDKMTEELEAKGIDPLEAGSIAMVSSQIYIASCVAGAMLGAEGDSEVQQQIFGDMGALETRLAEMLQDKT